MRMPVTSPVGPSTGIAVAPVPPNDLLGRYTLLERIGEGGMAEIYTAASHGAEGFERRFVVKRLHQHLARAPIHVDRELRVFTPGLGAQTRPGRELVGDDGAGFVGEIHPHAGLNQRRARGAGQRA